MFVPYVGCIVWYHQGPDDGSTAWVDIAAAVITRVTTDCCISRPWCRRVDLTVFSYNGLPSQKIDVRLHQPGDEPALTPYCERIPHDIEEDSR